MGYFQVRYGSRVINYDRRGFIRFATGSTIELTDWILSYRDLKGRSHRA